MNNYNLHKQINQSQNNIESIKINRIFLAGKGITLRKLIDNICKSEHIKPNIVYMKKIKNSIEPEKFWSCNKKLKICLQRNN